MENQARDMSAVTAAEARAEGGLPQDGRGAPEPLARLEAVLRGVFPHGLLTWDVNSVQGTDFDEWTYTEGLGCILVSTQSVEINARLMLAAVESGARPDTAAVDRIRTLADKWAPVEGPAPPSLHADGLRVFFPPGGNLGWVIATDAVLRAFRSDDRWRLKPHPVTSDQDVRQARLAFGAARVLPRGASGMAALHGADEVGYTTTSEMGLVAGLAGKPTHDFTLFEFEHCGRYHPIYLARRLTGASVEELLGAAMGCPWSGLVPLDTPSDEAAARFRSYQAKTLALRQDRRPLIRDPKWPRPGR